MNKFFFPYPFSEKRPHLRAAQLTLILSIAAAAVWITASAGSCHRNDKKMGPNVIVICVDSLRADHVGCYGYRRRTSPRIDALARTGIVFEHAYANSSYTRESVAAIHSGLLPSVSGSTGLLAVPRAERVSIGDHFTTAGYRTGFFSASSILDKKEFSKGFASIHVDEKQNNRNSLELSNRAIGFIQQNRERKFMLYLHYMDPHHPYNPPPEFYRRFSPVVYDDPIDLQEDSRTRCHKWIRDGFGPGDPRYEDMVLRYDAEIAYTDHAIGLVLDKLKELRLLDNTLIVLTSDHGEEFLEHRYVVHAWTLFNESIHVPLIFWGKPFFTPGRIGAPVSGIDILPTLLSLAGIPHDPKNFDGHSLFTQRERTLSFQPPPGPYVGELLLQHRNMVRAVRKGNWKYLAAVIWTEPESRPRDLPHKPDEIAKNSQYQVDAWSPVRYEALFDLTADPLEKTDVRHANPAILNEMRALLARHEIRCRAIQKEYLRKMALPAPSSHETKKLKSLGYL